MNKLITDISQIQEEVGKYEEFFIVEDKDIIMDIGAHIGEFSKLHLKTASKVYAVEPDPLFYKEFAHLKNKRLIPINKGVGSTDHKSRIKSDGRANTIDSKEGVSIDVVTFRTLVQEQAIRKIDFLKIDCEGCEYDILTSDNIRWISKHVRKVAGEFHIHNRKHRILLPYVLLQLEENGITPTITSLDGTILDIEDLLGRLHYFTEVLFYFRTDDDFIEL